MLIATDSLRSPELRIGKISETITLPRTVRAASAAAGAAGSFVGMILASALIGMTLQTLAYGAIVGGLAGIGVVSYSPLRGESLGRWVLLKLKARKHRTDRHGQPVRLAVGVCYIEPTAEGLVRVNSRSVDVRAGSVDDRFFPTTRTKHQVSAQHRLGLRALPAELEELDVSKPRTEAPAASPVASQQSARMAAFRSVAEIKTKMSSPLDAYRTALQLESSLTKLEDQPLRDNSKVAGRRHGRWEQNPTALNQMYSATGADTQPVKENK